MCVILRQYQLYEGMTGAKFQSLKDMSYGMHIELLMNMLEIFKGTRCQRLERANGSGMKFLRAGNLGGKISAF